MEIQPLPAPGRLTVASLAGAYYRGTATGEDHNLTLEKDGALSLGQNRGCFSSDPTLRGRWTLTGSRIAISGPPELLKRRLGPTLAVDRTRGFPVLVPALTRAESQRTGNTIRHAYWPEARRSEGLELARPRAKAPGSASANP